MRILDEKIMKARGCKLCANFKKEGDASWCMFTKCPYKELDGLKDYEKEFNNPKRQVEIESYKN